MLTFDTNRLGNVLQRRFNAAWRETDQEPVWLLPQCAQELMGHRINPYALELGMKNVREELVSCVINKCGFSAQEKGCGEARPAGNTWPYCQGT